MGVEFPILSSEVVRLIDCRERQLHEAVRQGVVHPQVVAGRRLWRADGVLKVDRQFNLGSPETCTTCQPEAGITDSVNNRAPRRDHSTRGAWTEGG